MLIKIRVNMLMMTNIKKETDYPKVIVEQKVLKFGVLVVSLLDVTQEPTPNDATTSPHQSDTCQRERLRTCYQGNKVGAC